MKYETLYQRITTYGYSDEEASRLKPWEPRWVIRIEEKEGKPIREVIVEGAKAGMRPLDFGRAWGVDHQAVKRLCKRYGVTWKTIPVIEEVE